MLTFLFSLSGWDWFAFLGLFMVFIGVWFGHIANKNNSPRANLWEGILIIGLAIDIVAFFKNVKDVATLKHENLVLELKLQPRIISAKQIRDFMLLTEGIPKIPVRVDVGNGVFNQEACNFAYQIREMLEMAKFTVPDSDTNYAMHVFNEPTRTYISKEAPTDLIMFVEGPGLDNPQFETISGMKRPIAQKGNTNDIYAALYYAFKDSGISIGLNSKPDWTHDTHMEIFVRQKP